MENQVVIKCGGSTLEGLPASFYTDIKELQDEGTAVTIVHGGGPAISATLKQMGIEPQFVDGLRVTDAATLQVAQMVLIGQTNKQIVSRIQAAGAGRLASVVSTGQPFRLYRDPHILASSEIFIVCMASL